MSNEIAYLKNFLQVRLVSDFEKARTYYRDVLGFQVEDGDIPNAVIILALFSNKLISPKTFALIQSHINQPGTSTPLDGILIFIAILTGLDNCSMNLSQRER